MNRIFPRVIDTWGINLPFTEWPSPWSLAFYCFWCPLGRPHLLIFPNSADRLSCQLFLHLNRTWSTCRVCRYATLAHTLNQTTSTLIGGPSISASGCCRFRSLSSLNKRSEATRYSEISANQTARVHKPLAPTMAALFPPGFLTVHV